MRAALHLRVHVAWWVRPYITTVTLFAITFGLTPDFEKVTATVMRGVRISLTP